MNMHTQRPSVYLDQWVWVRLARAAVGRASHPDDEAALVAVREASAAGVAFPLSNVHYVETSRIKDPRQRYDLAAVMAPISCCRTLRCHRTLIRHQMLTAMHDTFGRPAFRPAPPEVLGLGVAWAFVGQSGHFRVHGPEGVMTEAVVPGVAAWLRRANQHAEMRLLAGPLDEEVESLREYGYRPEKVEQSTGSRLEWEQLYEGLLQEDPVSRAELRVRVQARELVHEHLDLLNALMLEYGLSLDRALGTSSKKPGAVRAQMVAFADRIPSIRIAVDMKVELFRNAARIWTVNDLHDVDALTIAVPYCHVVVADKDAVDRLRRSDADARHTTTVLSRLRDLPEHLEPLGRLASALGGDPTGWDAVGPGRGFSTAEPGPLEAAP
jgi:hypothetical protein